MLISLILFAIGLALVITSASYLVDGASSLAKKFGVSALVIGLTIVAFGTSAPEFTVNLFASFNGEASLAIGNIIGSNIANVFLILGLTAAIFPLAVKKEVTWRELPFALISVILVFIMSNDHFFDPAAASALGRVDGLILLAFFAVFLYYTYNIKTFTLFERSDIKIYSSARSWIMIISGLVGLALGGKIIVDSAVNIALGLGISEAVIGLTIVAIGTSLPELATSVVAAYKKNADIAVGNIIGSNIFNSLWILGFSAVVRPLPFARYLDVDLGVAIFSMLLLFIFMFIGKRHVLDRWQGALFVVFYAAYLFFLIGRH